MTPNEIATTIAESAKRQLDIPFKLMVFDLVKGWRSTLIKNTIERTPSMRNAFLQKLVISTEPHSSAGCTLPTCYDSAITKDKVPQAIRVGITPYAYVGGVHGDNPYTYGQAAAVHYLSGSKYSKRTTYWHKLDDKIFLSNPAIVNVRIEDVFDDPLEVAKLQCLQTNTKCDVWDSPYPAITNDILQQCIKYVTEYILSSPNTVQNEEEIKPDSNAQAS